MKPADTPERSSYTPAVIAAGAGIALYVASKIGELVVILLMWGAYAALAYGALHVVAAWLGVPLLELVREAAARVRDLVERRRVRQHADTAISILRGRRGG